MRWLILPALCLFAVSAVCLHWCRPQGPFDVADVEQALAGTSLAPTFEEESPDSSSCVSHAIRYRNTAPQPGLGDRVQQLIVYENEGYLERDWITDRSAEGGYRAWSRRCGSIFEVYSLRNRNAILVRVMVPDSQRPDDVTQAFNNMEP